MREDMIERLAACLWRLWLGHLRHSSGVLPDWETFVRVYPKIADQLRDDARTVLEVMREPTEAMTEAGRKHCEDSQSNYGDAQANAVFGAMVDAALKQRTHNRPSTS